MSRFLYFEMIVHLKNIKDIILFCFFFLSICFIFPFTLSPEPEILRNIFPGVIWTALLLSSFISLNRLFQDDIEEGFSDRYMQLNLPNEALFFIKAVVFSFSRMLPLAFMIPFIGLLYTISLENMIDAVVVMMISAPSILFFGAFSALLTVYLKTAGIMIFILTFPLILPAVIFSAGGMLADYSLWDKLFLPLSFSLFSCSITTLLSPLLMTLLHEEA